MRWKHSLSLLIGLLCILELTNAQFTAVVINNNNNNSNEPSTQAPSDSPVTGKIRQFKGFNTPRPFPPNANFVYASIWASWSAWSFCTSNKVQIRVRACNTVRGYSCQGPNRETKPCDILPTRQEDENQQKEHTDYDAHDSFEADRREALRQLNPSTDLKPKEKVPVQEFRRQLSAGKTHVHGPKGPPSNSTGRQPSSGIAHAPSMTPELLYERKHFVDTDVPLKKPLAFASKNTKESTNIVDKNIPRDHEVTMIQDAQTTKQPSVVDKDSKSKPSTSKLRDSQSVSSSVLVGNTPHTNGPINQSPRLSNRQPFTKAPFDPTTQRFVPTTSKFVPSITPKSPLRQGTIGRGDHVQITSSVQQHFKEGSSPPFNGVSSSISALKLRDFGTNQSSQPQVQAHIKEEPLATALEPEQPNKSNTETPPPQENISNIITSSPDRPMIAQKPTAEEIENMARRLEKTRLSGEAGQLKGNLHSGEVNHNKLPAMNDETAKALEWMLKNMSDATQPVAKPVEMPTLNLDTSSSEIPAPIQPQDNRRAFASKIIPEGRFSKFGRSQSRVSNPDEDAEGKQLESELNALKESMQQMETELKELREAEVDSQEPKFNIRKAINLNLVPNAPPKFKTPIIEEPRISDKPSELFLLDHFEHKSSAHWSDWGPFGECFCNKRIRTRNCVYDDPAHSEGCEGRSYESIRCVGGRPCPAQRTNLSINRRTSNPNKSTTTVSRFNPSTRRFYTISSSTKTTEQPPHGDLFYPNPLPTSRRHF